MANFPQMDSKGCVAVSICSLCYKDAEMSNHLLLHYDFSQQVWFWLSFITGYHFNYSSPLNLLLEIANSTISP